MEFLSLDNILLLRRVIGENKLSEEQAKKLASIMQFLNKYTDRVSLKTLNMMVLYMYKKMSATKTPEPNALLDQLNLPKELTNAYRLSLHDFSQIRHNTLIKKDINFLQNLYEETNNFYRSYVKEIPDDQSHASNFIIAKTKQMKELEEELFRSIKHTTYLTIDSRDRNHDHDAANKYRIYLAQHLKNVYSMELISAEVPKSTYAVNEYNNIIHFQETNTQVATNTYYEAAIPVGNYTISEVLPLIQSAMNAVGSSSYVVALVNNRVRITSDLTGGDNIFRLEFRSLDNDKRYKAGSFGRQLGYAPLYKSESASYTAEALYDLDYDHFALLNFTNIKLNSSQLNGVFQKIPMNNDNIVYFGHKKDYRMIHEFYPPIEIDYLDIQWTDIDGNLMHFHGLPHSFTVKVDMFT